MIKLSEMQRNVLASACEREDGFASRPATLRPGAAAKLAAKLIELGLVRELRAKGSVPVWRTDEQDRAFALKIMKAGRTAVQASVPQPSVLDAKVLAEKVAPQGDDGAQTPGREDSTIGRGKSGSKRTLVLALLERVEGATVDDLMAATGWLPHTTRAALSVLRKGGLGITRSRDSEGQASVYRVEVSAAAAAA